MGVMGAAKNGRWSHPIWLFAIVFLAIGLRFWQLETMPPGLYHDEAYNGLDALSLLRGEQFPLFYEGWELYAQDAHAERPPTPTRFPLFFEGNYGREPVHVYLMAVSIWLLGATPTAIRAVPAAAGVVAVVTTYIAATVLFCAPRYRAHVLWQDVPLLSAFFVAILYPAITFSRFGLRAMLFVPVETLAVACFWRGHESTTRHRWLWYGAAGVFLGSGLYVYAAGRLLPLLFVLFAVYLTGHNRVAWRETWGALAVMGGTAVVVAAPLMLFFLRYPYFFVFRIAYVANKGKGAVEGQAWLTWLLNIGRVFRGFFWLGETHLRHNLPGRPYLDLIQATFFAIGNVVTWRQWRQPRPIFVWLWLLVMLLPTIMSGDAPHFGRMTGALPAVALLIALGIHWLVQKRFFFFSNAQTRSTTFYMAAISLLLLMVSTSLTIRDYFGRYANYPQLVTDFYLDDWRLGRYLATQTADTSLYLTPTQEEMATIYFALMGDRERLRSYSGSGSLLPLGRLGSGVVYAIRPYADAALNRVQTQLPEAEVATMRDGFIPVQVSADNVRLPSETAAYIWADKIKLLGWVSEVQTGQVQVTLYWQALAPMDQAYTAFVHILDPAGNLVAQRDRQPNGYPTTDWLVGEVIMDTFTIPLPPDLTTDTYAISTGFYYAPPFTPLAEPTTLESILLP